VSYLLVTQQQTDKYSAFVFFSIIKHRCMYTSCLTRHAPLTAVRSRASGFADGLGGLAESGWADTVVLFELSAEKVDVGVAKALGDLGDTQVAVE